MSDIDNILRKENIITSQAGAKWYGYVYVRDYNELPTKNGSVYYGGNVECIGSVHFKVWAGNTFNVMKENPMSNTICWISAEVNDFSGTKSLVVNDIKPYEGDELVPEMFMEQKYNPEELWTKLKDLLSKHVSSEAYQVFETVINDYKDRFMVEYCAISHHDSCMSGLLAHTKKVVSIVQILRWYPNIIGSIDTDLLFVSAALHDIGKVLEYNNGVITEIGKRMSHNTIGVEMLRPYKDVIIGLKGECFYEDLISVIQQHHGEFGERPRTVASLLISKIDGLEANLTDIDELLHNATTNQIRYEDYKLSF